ncbi:MAG: SufD family Fe-S cluster assembly protein [Bacteroidota bacterium]|nr:SufD family Fe-S cluster assembly protein [Bacteroidota bacterium]
MKRITISKNEIIDYSKYSKESSNFNIRVKRGVKLVLILKNNPADIKVMVGAKANVTIINYIQKVKKMDTKVQINLVGSGAEANVYYALHGQINDKHIFDITMRHQVRNTKGDILIKGVYQNKSIGKFVGLIKIDKKAQGTNSYFTDNVLLLDQAMATSIPNLEIEANEVKASHGSTTGRINNEQMFYLMSRGLSKTQAKKMIINGFFQPIFNRLPNDIKL